MHLYPPPVEYGSATSYSISPGVTQKSELASSARTVRQHNAHNSVTWHQSRPQWTCINSYTRRPSYTNSHRIFSCLLLGLFEGKLAIDLHNGRHRSCLFIITSFTRLRRDQCTHFRLAVILWLNCQKQMTVGRYTGTLTILLALLRSHHE